MARLYNGFNALALGSAINNTNNNVHNNRMTGLQMLGSSLQDVARAKKEEDEKELRRQSAMDFLTGNGMSQENAQNMVNTGIEPGQLALYMQGRLDKAKDTEAANARSDFEYERAREDKLNDEEWNKEIADLDKMQDAREQRQKEIEDKEFNALNTRYQLLLSKQQSGALMSQADVDELNQVKEQLDKWLWKHPHYTQMNIDYSNNGSSVTWTDKTATDALNALIENDGKVDPKNLKDLDERYLRETGRTLAKDLPDYYNYVAKKQRGSKSKRNSDNPNSGGVNTEEDYKRIYENEQEMARLNALQKNLVRLMTSGAPLPDVSEKDLDVLEQMEKDGKITKGIVFGYRARKDKK